MRPFEPPKIMFKLIRGKQFRHYNSDFHQSLEWKCIYIKLNGLALTADSIERAEPSSQWYVVRTRRMHYTPSQLIILRLVWTVSTCMRTSATWCHAFRFFDWSLLYIRISPLNASCPPPFQRPWFDLPNNIQLTIGTM